MLTAESVHLAPFPLPTPKHILVLFHLDPATLLVGYLFSIPSSCLSSSGCCICNQEKEKEDTDIHTHRSDGVIHLLRLEGTQSLPITHKIRVSDCDV